MSKIINCPLCGKELSVSQNSSCNCSECTAEIKTDNMANISQATLHHERLLAHLKSLASRRKSLEIDTLLVKLRISTLSDVKNREELEKAIKDFLSQKS